MIVLATASKPRRRLMKMCRRNVIVKYSNINESKREREDIYDYLYRITYQKAIKFAGVGRTVVSADTVIVCDGAIIGKPKDGDEAFFILRLLSGRNHYCYSGVSILSKNSHQFFVEYAILRMKYLSDDEIYEYLDRENYSRYAAGYAIQGLARGFIDIVKGDITTVIGLPMKRLCRII